MPARTPYPRANPAAALAIAIRPSSFHIVAHDAIRCIQRHYQIQYFCGTKLTRRIPRRRSLNRCHAPEHKRKCRGQQTYRYPAQQDDPGDRQHPAQTKDGVRPKLFERRNDIGVTIAQHAMIHSALCTRNAGRWSGVAGVALRRPREQSSTLLKRPIPSSLLAWDDFRYV